MIDNVLSNQSTWHIETGDALNVLRGMPDECVHCAVTSPPYWGLRDYGVTGQVGLESSLDEYVSNLTEIFREVRRVLRADGTLWLNLGDKYANRGYAGYGDPTVKKRNLGGMTPIERKIPCNLKQKDLIGLPWRVAFALQADGWWIRQENVWHKPNPMPESVVDRTTRAHESIFMLTKSPKYFYDGEAIKEPSKEKNRCGSNGASSKGGRNSHANVELIPKAAGKRKQDAVGKKTYLLFNERYRSTGKRNLRSVWNIATHPYPEAHFATFPPRIPEICIRAGTSMHGVCSRCGAPWKRIVEKNVRFESGSGRSGNAPEGKHNGGVQTLSGKYDIRMGPVVKTETKGWEPTCECDCSTVPAVVLDPFAGAGTTLLVACRLVRRSIGIELNPKYVQIACNRILDDAPLINAI